MSGRISLSLVLHNHQPVGNFGWVFGEVYAKAYEPMVAAIERHPGLHLGLHYTGPLLEWLRAERPEFIARLRALVDNGQVEILGGGLYEPVLASLPERDRIGQLERMAVAIEAAFGRRPTGAWLAERVWEPDIPTSLVAAGYRYTILDDAHFRAAAIAEDAMWGPYTTDDQGRLLTVFGTEQGLRYRIPFQPVAAVIDYLREHATEAGERVGMMGDDGEKFGSWPTTWEHCWGRGRWVEDFFGALEANAGWLTTVRPSDWLGANPPVGRVYVPTGSYAEMGEWALPPDESVAFADALHRAVATGAPEARWLRGGFWRNFQVKYREINDLHKQMLRVSAAVAAMPDGAPREAATDHLYRGQSNDCYWHGLFGGIYIAHMRAATFEHLIAAEDLADTALEALDAAAIADLDLDGRDEVRLATPGQVVTVKLDEGAGIGSWDLRAARHALTAVLRRRPERYHALLQAHEAALAAPPPGGTTSGHGTAAAGDRDGPGAKAADPPAEGPASIHDLVRTKEVGLANLLRYDGYERRSGLVRSLPLTVTAADWAAGGGADLGTPDAAAPVAELGERRLVTVSETSIDGQAVTIRRELTLGGGRLDPSLGLRVILEHRGDRPLGARIGLEWAVTMLGGGGNPAAWWEVEGVRSRHDGSGEATSVTELAQGNDWLGVAVTTRAEPAADAWWAPIETISNSENGFERVYQGGALLLSWPVELRPGGRWSAAVEHQARVATERS
ncbi:MAG TPA: alpha-amylase/4-alpha-glucanotransferase domain-containing protein [Candidatus Limnocylindrales bacterium]|nr:alpha-amylase/4-alpha-glucanotransferase domain-containing protein [Candidatus Limnocylindrales bacterium]